MSEYKVCHHGSPFETVILWEWIDVFDAKGVLLEGQVPVAVKVVFVTLLCLS